MASAVRNVSWQAVGPHDTAMTSVALPASFCFRASSTAISQKGFMDIFTLASSTPLWSAFTRTLTLKSTTRFTGTRSFMGRGFKQVFEFYPIGAPRAGRVYRPRARSRSTNFWILPVEVFGSSPKITVRGTL